MRFELWIAIGLLGAGCADFQRGPAASDAGAKLDSSSSRPLVADYTFEAEVYPVLLRRCGDCHKVGGIGEFTKYVLTGNARADRPMVLDLVVPGDPTGSLFIRRASGESHTGKVTLAPNGDEYETVANWISMLPVQ